MFDLTKKILYLGLGTLTFTKEKAEQVVNELIKKGEVKQEEAANLVDDLVKRGQKEKENLKEIINHEVTKILAEMNIATKVDIKHLEDKIKLLEDKLQSE